MTPALLSLLFSISTLTNRVTPPGTQLHIRLTSTVGSYASRAGSPLSAVLIAPVTLDGETRLQTGTILSGSVKGVTRVGFGVRHETAGLDLEFNRLTSPDGENIPIFARVAEVDNSRERVTMNGRIHGVRSTASLCYRVSGYIRTVLQWELHAGLAVWAIRSLLMQLPEPEIYYPAGVELTLTLTRPTFLGALLNPEEEVGAQLSDGQRDELERVVSALPYRTQAPGAGRFSDLTNVLFIGSRDQVATAFNAAGWTQANRASVRGRITWLRAVAERRGDESAPMSPLLLNGAESDMAWEKGLNDVSKRHHIRMWRGAGAWDGQETWVGAATRDVDFAYLRPGGRLTHRIDEDVDQERDKVAYDMAFTSCGSILDWTGREGFPRFTRNATGDPITTDGRMVVIRMNECRAPRMSTETVDSAVLPEHGDRLQRLARREILSARNELLRTNPVWRTYESSRWIFDYFRRRRQQAADQLLWSSSHPSVLPQFAVK